jgi:hypothetical protein
MMVDLIRVKHAALVVALALLLPQSVMAQTVNYSRDPNKVVASYALIVGELEDADPGPSVHIYGDGRALVHVPRYRKDAGDFTTQLSPAEMDNLMASLVANGLMEFDPAAVQQAKRAFRDNRGSGAAAVLYESTDPSITTIELHVRRTGAAQGSGAAGPGAEIGKTVRWSGLEADAQQFADIAAIRKLDAAAQRFKALMERPDLQRVR